MLPIVRMRTAAARLRIRRRAQPRLLACRRGEMDGQRGPLESRAALRGRSLRRHAARGTIINGAFLVGLNTLGLMRGFLLAGFLATFDYGGRGVLSVAVAGLFWFKDVGVPDKYVQQDEADQQL